LVCERVVAPQYGRILLGQFWPAHALILQAGIVGVRRREMKSRRIEELEAKIEDLKSRWPAHSVPRGMFQQLDELEEELQAELKKTAERWTRAEARDRHRSSF